MSCLYPSILLLIGYQPNHSNDRLHSTAYLSPSRQSGVASHLISSPFSTSVQTCLLHHDPRRRGPRLQEPPSIERASSQFSSRVSCSAHPVCLLGFPCASCQWLATGDTGPPRPRSFGRLLLLGRVAFIASAERIGILGRGSALSRAAGHPVNGTDSLLLAWLRQAGVWLYGAQRSARHSLYRRLFSAW